MEKKKMYTEYYIYEFIGTKNKYELVSFLNSDLHKINNGYNDRNINMKLTLQKNIKDNSVYTLTF